jgi:4'-phosphopantetheinyl transferase
VTRSNRVGIDVETTGKNIDEESTGRYLSQSEAAALAARSRDERALHFLELWTLKEACVKAVGLGLAESFQRFSFVLDRASIHFEDTMATGMKWSFALFAPSPRHRMAVAVVKSGDAVRITLCPTDEAPAAPFLRGST